MLFETIITRIKNINTFVELSEYITSDVLYKQVDTFLKSINSQVNPKNILTSFLLKYEIDNDLYQPYNDSDNILNITEEIAKLHAALVGNIPPHVLCEIIINFVQKFKIWKEIDKKHIITNLKRDYMILKIKYEKEDNTSIRESMLLLINNYKNKLLKLVTEEEFNEIEQDCVNKSSPRSLKTFMKNSYHKYLTDNLKENNIEVVTQNLTELREYILLCTKDKALIEEMVDILYIEYLSDEELFKFLYNYCNFLLRLTAVPADIKLIKSVKKTLDNNVSLDTEMYKFIPEVLNLLFELMDVLIMEKNDY